MYASIRYQFPRVRVAAATFWGCKGTPGSVEPVMCELSRPLVLKLHSNRCDPALSASFPHRNTPFDPGPRMKKVLFPCGLPSKVAFVRQLNPTNISEYVLNP